MLQIVSVEIKVDHLKNTHVYIVGARIDVVVVVVVILRLAFARRLGQSEAQHLEDLLIMEQDFLAGV